MDYTLLLQYLLPGVEWSCGETYESIVILTPGIPVPTQEQFAAAWPQAQLQKTILAYGTAMQSLIDSTASSKSYADGYAVASYVTSTNAQWAAQAVTFVAWRDACWEYSYAVQQAAESDPSSAPTLPQFIAQAPQISW